MKLGRCVALAIGLLAAGCTSAEDPFEREAAAIVERASESTGDASETANTTTSETSTSNAADSDDRTAEVTDAATSANGCILSVVEDEYGLPIEIELCPDDDSESPPLPANGRSSVLADPWFGSADSRELTRVITHRVLTPCSDEQPAYPALPAAIQTALGDVIAAIDSVQQHCTDGEQFRLASNDLFAQIEMASNALLGRGPRSAVLARSDEQLVAQAVEHVEWLSWVLDGATGIVSHRPPLWFGSAIRGHIMATPELTDIDTLLLGNSQTQFGVNPDGLSVAAYNASVPGSEPSAYAELYEYFSRGTSIDPTRVVLGLSAVDFIVSTPGGCSRDTGASLDAMFELHATLYASAPLELNTLGMERLVARPSLRQSLTRTPLAGDHNRRVSSLGAGLSFPELTEETRQIRFQTRADVFEAWIECSARFRDVTRLLNTASRRSDQVIVVLMPLDADLIALAPDQTASVNELNDRITTTVEEGGGTVVDLTTLLSSAEMIDAVHPTEAGAGLVTAAVDEALGAS